MKLLSLIIPFYQAEEFILNKPQMWQKLAQLTKLIIVEDNQKGNSQELWKKTLKKLPFEYYKKENGNWGSVMNFIKKNQLIKTKYMAILDADDEIDIDELKKFLLILKTKTNDIVLANYIKRSKNKDKIYDFKNLHTKKRIFPFIHGFYFSKKIFYQTEDLPEKCFYTDNFLVINLLTINSLPIFYCNLTPYIYFKKFYKKQSTYLFPKDAGKHFLPVFDYKKYYKRENELAKIVILHELEKFIIVSNNKINLLKAKKVYKKVYKNSKRSHFFNHLIFIKILRIQHFWKRKNYFSNY